MQEKKCKHANLRYFSPTIQNYIISIIGNKVRKELISRIKTAKYYAMLFDCAPDTSHKEQMSEIIRYVRIEKDKCSIEESFIDYIESK